MGNETFHMSIFLASMLPRDDGFSSLINFLRILTFSVFRILTVKVRLGSSPRIKQLSERSCAESRLRAAGVGTSFRGVKSGSKRKIAVTNLEP